MLKITPAIVHTFAMFINFIAILFLLTRSPYSENLINLLEPIFFFETSNKRETTVDRIINYLIAWYFVIGTFIAFQRYFDEIYYLVSLEEYMESLKGK